jgi:hypothetical protein
LAEPLFEGLKLRDTLQDIIRLCQICHITTPTTLPCLSLELRSGGMYPWEDWQLDFNNLPGGLTSRMLLVLVDIFTEWVEGFPCSSEKVLINEIIPRFGFPQTLQIDNGQEF